MPGNARRPIGFRVTIAAWSPANPARRRHLTRRRNKPLDLALRSRQTFEEDQVMARATAHPDHRCISSEDVQGTEVYGAADKNIGEIDHLIIDKVSGRVAYAVMSFGGFMGLGHSHYPIPWDALSYN